MEYLDIYDKSRNKTGRTRLRTYPATPLEDGEYALGIRVWLKNPEGKFLITQRHPDKSEGLCWETTGGAVLAGESSLEGALREVKEEIGVALDGAEGVCFLTQTGPHSINDEWLFHVDLPVEQLTLQQTEVVNAKWAAPEEIDALYEKGEFISFSGDFRMAYDL